MAEEYEILPHQLLEELKGEVEVLKKKLMEPDAKAQELILEIESLKDSVHDLYDLFQKALDITKGENISSTIATLKEKVEAVIKQNETIARALLTISDKMDQQPKPFSPPPASAASFPMSPPSLPGARMAPRPEMPLMNDFPPPPPRKKGLFP